MQKTKNVKKFILNILLSKLADLVKNYTRSLEYIEQERLYYALGPLRHFVSTNHFNQYLRRMEKRGWVERRKSGPEVEIRMTAHGVSHLRESRMQELVLKTMKKWDGKWRLVIFDIPEERKLNRKSFRYHIKSLGFKQVQKSVWAYPYPCIREISILCSRYQVEPYIVYFEGVYFGNDRLLRSAFNLTKNR